MAHNSTDKQFVRGIAAKLNEAHIDYWLDEEQIKAGEHYIDQMQAGIQTAQCAVIFIGSEGLGNWQTAELRALQNRGAAESFVLIPVLCPGVTEIPNAPRFAFLRGRHYVRFHNECDNQAFQELINGIAAAVEAAAANM